jgi:hypothetical protein
MQAVKKVRLARCGLADGLVEQPAGSLITMRYPLRLM